MRAIFFVFIFLIVSGLSALNSLDIRDMKKQFTCIAPLQFEETLPNRLETLRVHELRLQSICQVLYKVTTIQCEENFSNSGSLFACNFLVSEDLFNEVKPFFQHQHLIHKVSVHLLCKRDRQKFRLQFRLPTLSEYETVTSFIYSLRQEHLIGLTIYL